jgi:hypothetical protein
MEKRANDEESEGRGGGGERKRGGRESAGRESIRNHGGRARVLAGIFLHLHAIFELFRANGGEEWIYDSIKRVCPAIFRLVPQNDSTIASRMALEKPPAVVFACGA